MNELSCHFVTGKTKTPPQHTHMETFQLYLIVELFLVTFVKNTTQVCEHLSFFLGLFSVCCVQDFRTCGQVRWLHGEGRQDGRVFPCRPPPQRWGSYIYYWVLTNLNAACHLYINGNLHFSYPVSQIVCVADFLFPVCVSNDYYSDC